MERSRRPSDLGGISRREFLKLTAAGAVAAGVSGISWAAESKSEIPHRILGRTGEKVSIVGLGGYHMASPPDEQDSLRIVRTAIDSGINFMDNCWDYHDGLSEERMGKALRDGYRKRVFLMTKIDGRERKAAAKQIEDSLRRLQTDVIDLMQMHEVIRMNDPDRIFASGGAMEALLEAKKAGKIRYIGFTGHKSPAIHLKMLETAAAHQFVFDAVQMPLNVMDAHFDSFEKRVVPELLKQRIGVLGMKPMGSGVILRSRAVTPIECLHYAMNLPTSVVITGCESVKDVEQAVKAALTFKPMAQMEVAALLAKTADAAKNGQYELYKTSEGFDGTVRNPQWLG